MPWRISCNLLVLTASTRYPGAGHIMMEVEDAGLDLIPIGKSFLQEKPGQCSGKGPQCPEVMESPAKGLLLVPGGHSLECSVRQAGCESRTVYSPLRQIGTSFFFFKVWDLAFLVSNRKIEVFMIIALV